MMWDHTQKQNWILNRCCFLNRILNIAFLLFLEIQGWKHGCDHGCWPGNGFSTNHVSMKSPNHGILGLNLWTIVIIFLSQRQGFAALSVCDFSIHQPHSKNCSALPRLGFFALLPWNWGLLFLISMVNRWITWLQDFRGSIYKLYIYIYIYVYIYIYFMYIIYKYIVCIYVYIQICSSLVYVSIESHNVQINVEAHLEV